MSRRDRALLLTAGALLVASLAVIGLLPVPHAQVPVFLGGYALAFVAYAIGVRTVLRQGECTRATLWIILAVAALARAVVIPSRPDLSTDIYRYNWEGRIMQEGVNPFATAPTDTSLAHLRDENYALISHQTLATIYPPLAQAAFALAAWIDPDVRTLKIIFSLVDLGTVLILFRLLRSRGRPEAHALVYAWSPLVVIETAHSGHVDALGVFLLVLGLALWLSGKRVWAGVALGGSFLSKYLAAAMGPWLARRRQRAALVTMGVVIGLGYVPFLGAGPELVASLREYSASWWFNGPPFIAMSGVLGDPMLVRRLLAAFGVVFAIAAAFRERDLLRYAYLVIGCMLLLSPTVYPWYVIWIVPFLCVFTHRAWMAFTALVMLSYAVWIVYDRTGAWMLPTWLLAVEYLPFYALLLIGLARSRRGEEAA